MFYLILSTPGFANNMDNMFEFVLGIVMAYFMVWGVIPFISGLSLVVFADHIKLHGPCNRSVATAKRVRWLKVIGWTLVACSVPFWVGVAIPIVIVLWLAHAIYKWVFPAIGALFRRSTWVRVVYGPVNG